MKSSNVIIALIVIIGVAFYASAFVVDETEQVVVTRFGKVMGDPKTEPGLNFKIPVFDIANYFPKNLQQWDGESGQVPTLDKTYIWVDTFARWRIIDPVKFFQTVGNTTNAMGRLDDIIDSAARNFITSYPLIESVRQGNRKLVFDVDGKDDVMIQMDVKSPAASYVIKFGRGRITQGIKDQAQPKLFEFGIELVDVKLKRINYVEEVRSTVYERMIAERKQMAEKFRSEGRGEARKWLGKKEKDLKKITSEAYKKAQEIKGKADASVTKTLAQAYGKDPEFYSFIKTLETYDNTFDDKSSIVLSTDSEFFKYLKGYSGKP
ncbi:MAG: protease modulator HflC [Desulfobacterales bacterium]